MKLSEFLRFVVFLVLVFAAIVLAGWTWDDSVMAMLVSQRTL